jgi:Rrf2 family protein
LALVELARAGPTRTLSAGQIAENRSIPEKYLEQILATLKAAGLVLSFRGRGGGYTLSKAPSRITLSDVFGVLEGPPALVHCVKDGALCPASAACPTRSIWVEMTQALTDIMERTTLQDIVDREKKAVSRERLTYHI